MLAFLAGLHEPTSGRIVLSGTDAASLSRETRARQVSVVFQDSYLVCSTVRENVLVGDPGAGAASGWRLGAGG